MGDVETLTIAELISAYRKRSLSPVEVVSSCLDRLDTLNPALNAFYFVDRDGALAAARDSERRWMSGENNRRLDGVPTSVKDALPAKGWPAFRGSAARSPEMQDSGADTPVVARLREEGAIFLGKTTMPDFGILASGYSSLHGITRNPWDLSRNTGGSSSGAAAAVAAGIHPFAVGTDIVGSIRLPASFCGIFGHKPSQGRVPYYFPNSPALVAGPMTRSVADAALVMNVVTQPDERDFTALPYDKRDYNDALRSDLKHCRIGILPSIGFGLQPHPEVIAATRKAARLLEEAGCNITELDVPFKPGDDRPAEIFYATRCYAEFMSYPEDRRRLATVIARWTAQIEGISARELYDCMNGMSRLREKTVRLMDGLDFLLLPSVPIPAYEADLPAPDDRQLFAPWCNNFLFNLSEQPASSVPFGLSSSGLPIGVQLVGRRFDDSGVLRMSKKLEELAPKSGSPIAGMSLDR